MSEFLAESYIPRAQATGAASALDDLSKAAAQLTREGTLVRLKKSIVVPEEEICFYLFEAASEKAVREAASRSGLRFERVAEAMSGWLEAPRPPVSGQAAANGDSARPEDRSLRPEDGDVTPSRPQAVEVDTQARKRV